MLATRHKSMTVFGRVVLVASLGGIKALTTVLGGLPASFPVPIVVVQHRRPTSNGGDPLAEILVCRTRLPVRVAEPGGSVHELGVTVLPAATTAIIDAEAIWSFTEKIPDVGVGDAVLISSAAAGPTIAVILTGRLADGATGCRAVKRNGGRVLVQEPAEAQAPDMPTNAIATGCADLVLPVDRLATALLALTTAPGAGDLLTVLSPPWVARRCSPAENQVFPAGVR